jgi:uncharacterized phage-associated protein
MLILHEQEKAYNAIKYFSQNTGMCGKKKLFKLLYALDFEHFGTTGRSVTGYTYSAWKMGPVPIELDREIKNGGKELLENFDLRVDPAGPYERLCFEPKTPFNAKVFSRRELAILKDVADRFAHSTSKEMEDWTHQEGMPWQRVYEVEHRPNGIIPFEYQLDRLPPDEKEALLEVAQEREALVAHYQ